MIIIITTTRSPECSPGRLTWFVDGLKKNSAGETNYMIGQESDIATGVYSETGQQV